MYRLSLVTGDGTRLVRPAAPTNTGHLVQANLHFIAPAINVRIDTGSLQTNIISARITVLEKGGVLTSVRIKPFVGVGGQENHNIYNERRGR